MPEDWMGHIRKRRVKVDFPRPHSDIDLSPYSRLKRPSGKGKSGKGRREEIFSEMEEMRPYTAVHIVAQRRAGGVGAATQAVGMLGGERSVRTIRSGGPHTGGCDAGFLDSSGAVGSRTRHCLAKRAYRGAGAREMNSPVWG